MKFRGEIEESWFKYWDKELREALWPFTIEFQVPIDEADSYWSKERRYDQLQDRLPKWERGVRRKAQKAWKTFFEFVEWMERRDTPVEVDIPADEDIEIAGLPVVMRGQETANPRFYNTYMPRVVEGLNRYVKRASMVFPALLKYRLPIFIDWKCSIGEGGEYKGGKILLCPTAMDSPDKTVQVMAHEMGHHLYRLLGSGEQDYWATMMGQNVEKLNLRDVVNKYGENADIYDNKQIKRDDPAMYLQLMGLYDNPYTRHAFQSIFTMGQLREALDAGKVPETVNVQLDPISGYAHKNTEEAFCEAIGNLVAYGTRTVPDRVRATLRKIYSGING
jgi:hypothetical protein